MSLEYLRETPSKRQAASSSDWQKCSDSRSAPMDGRYGGAGGQALRPGIRLRLLMIGSASDYRAVTDIARTIEGFALFLDHARSLEESRHLVGEHLYDLFLLTEEAGQSSDFIKTLRGRGIH